MDGVYLVDILKMIPAIEFVHVVFLALIDHRLDMSFFCEIPPGAGAELLEESGRFVLR